MFAVVVVLKVTQRTAQEYTSLARTYDEVMQPQSVMHEVKLSDYYEEILK